MQAYHTISHQDEIAIPDEKDLLNRLRDKYTPASSPIVWETLPYTRKWDDPVEFRELLKYSRSCRIPETLHFKGGYALEKIVDLSLRVKTVEDISNRSDIAKTSSNALKRPGAPKTKGAVRIKSGCYTCRIRRKVRCLARIMINIIPSLLIFISAEM